MEKGDRYYKHKDFEGKWSQKWDKDGIYLTKDSEKDKKNYYSLVEFAYPSGNLHVGHWYAFSIPDIYSRFKRMNGYNVLYPIGFDSFGLPAENAAIKNNKNPKEWTKGNIQFMRQQLRSMGAMFDWSREVISSDPEYYRWTQWMFTKMMEKDLVYKAKTFVNWCENCKTILANEQVVNGKCERCDSEVIQKEQEQWMFKITKYADRLCDDLDKLDWLESIKEAQRQWIGRKEGWEIDFKIKNENLKIFTTRPDTIFGVTYMVLAPEHSLVSTLKIENRDEVEKYIKDSKKKSELERQQSKEKTGVELKGVKAINPANKEEVPVWIADYVLSGYGTGAIMAVPAHDERDFEFAKKFGLEVKEVVENEKTINSGEFNGMHIEEAKEKIGAHIGGKKKKTYRLRDWGFSRQRYWGTPIPVVYDPEGKAFPVPEDKLPWLLPEDIDFEPDGTAPLARSKELKERTEKEFGEGWRPEVDTMDTFVDSTWYFYRYLDPKNNREFCAEEMKDSWMPIDLYMGGAEHTTMHLLYSRFWNKALFDLGLVSEEEPFKRRFNRGMILGSDGSKMSKSKGNVVDPDKLVEDVGADTVRMYLAFLGPYGVVTHYPWDPGGIAGIRRFLEKVWMLKEKVEDVEDIESEKLMAKTVSFASRDIERFKFNTAISYMMIFLNHAEKQESISKNTYKTFLRILAPFAPFLTEEIWSEYLGENTSIHLEAWPEVKDVNEDEVEIAIQVNGKVRTTVSITKGQDEKEIMKLVMDDENIKKWVTEENIRKIIYIQDKILNIVV